MIDSEKESTSSLLETLTQVATEDCQDDKYRARVLQEIHSPEWESLTDYEDWAYLIPDEIREVWRELDPKIRLALYVVAKEGAARGKGARDRTWDD